jgi:hypothetical protein
MTGPSGDPTRAGPPVTIPPVGEARLSMPEVEALCMKAARGAGMEWGVAEEAGMAARWLAARGMDGPGTLLALLRARGGRGDRDAGPRISGRDWRAAGGGTLCPVLAGAAYSDAAGDADTAIVLHDLAVPLLFLPFAGQWVRATGRSLAVSWVKGRAHIDRAGIVLKGDIEASMDMAGARVTVEAGARAGQGGAQQLLSRYPIDPPVWRALDAFALCTTVPPSARSRGGAGAEADDND